MEMAGVVVHVLNRAAKRSVLFSTPDDYAAFERVLIEAMKREPIRILALCLMPTHWHLVVWPTEDGQVARLLHWLTLTHATRWNASRGARGTGSVYQGRYKSFPVQDEHVLRACRYVERNALRAGLVARAEDWRWGSLWHRAEGDPAGLLSDGPIPLPPDWVLRVNRPESSAELDALRRSARRGCPLGTPEWTRETATQWGLLPTLQPLGRPRRAGGN